MKGSDILFGELSSDLLMEYEAYLKNRGNSPNTISFYMRILKAVYNRAVENGLTGQRNLFKSVYTGVEKTLKRAIHLNDIRRIKRLDLSLKPHLDFARDMFLFCFYTRGMSFVDMAYLKNGRHCERNPDLPQEKRPDNSCSSDGKSVCRRSSNFFVYRFKISKLFINCFVGYIQSIICKRLYE